MRLYVWLALIIAVSVVEAGRGSGRGSSSRGSSSRGSSSSGGSSWFSSSRPSPSYSRPAPSYSAPSPSYSKPSYPSPSSYSSPSHNTYSNPSPASYGWNVNSKPAAAPAPPKPVSNTNYGWNRNVAPPAYPGLANKPVSSVNSPPAYSPSFNNPPAYSANIPKQPSYNPSYANPPAFSANTIPKQPAYNPGYSNPSYTANNRPASYSGSNYHAPTYGNAAAPAPYAYGNTFGSAGLPSNTYISNNYYGSPNRGSYGGYGGYGSSFGGGGGSSFLTHALTGVGGYQIGKYVERSRHNSYDDRYYSSSSSRRRNWEEEDERKWRATTQAPYFENKVPGSESYLPAAAVVGAATAFGLVSLLPLNVPENKPLMYCNASDLVVQSPIQIGELIYACGDNQSVILSCPKTTEDLKVVDTCMESNMTLICDISNDANSISCKNGTVVSSLPMVCNSTIILNVPNSNETKTVLSCYQGALLSEKLAASVPTTTTVRPVEETTEKSLSFMARVHVFFLNLIGKGDKVTETTTVKPPVVTNSPLEEAIWIPEPLTIPPELLNENSTMLNSTTAMPIISTTTTESTTSKATSTKKPDDATVLPQDLEDDYFEPTPNN